MRETRKLNPLEVGLLIAGGAFAAGQLPEKVNAATIQVSTQLSINPSDVSVGGCSFILEHNDKSTPKKPGVNTSDGPDNYDSTLCGDNSDVSFRNTSSPYGVPLTGDARPRNSKTPVEGKSSVNVNLAEGYLADPNTVVSLWVDVTNEDGAFDGKYPVFQQQSLTGNPDEFYPRFAIYSSREVPLFDGKGKPLKLDSPLSPGENVYANWIITSKSPISDLNGNGMVDGADLEILVGEWMREGDSVADLNNDKRVGLGDFAIFASEYMKD